MKNRTKLATISLALLMVAGCNKSDSNNSNPANPNTPDAYPALNSTEQKLLGKWMITSVRDTSFRYTTANEFVSYDLGETRNNTSPEFSYTFTGTENSSGLPDYDYARMGDDKRYSIPGDERSAWLFDESKQRLYISINGGFFEILTLTDAALYIRMQETVSYSDRIVRTVYYERFTKIK